MVRAGQLGRGPAELARTQLGAAFEGSRGMAWGGHRFSLIIPLSLPAGANTAWQGILPKPGGIHVVGIGMGYT